MFNVQCFYCNYRALTPYDTDVRTLRDIGTLVGHGLPDVAVDLYAAKAIGFDGLHYPALTT